GFFVAAYTGALLTATNQPIWSDSVWLASLFLTSAASTGVATLMLLAHWRGRMTAPTRERLERADTWAVALELTVLVLFLVSLGGLLGQVFASRSGLLLVGAVVLGVLIPLALQLRLRLRKSTGHRQAMAAAGLA